MNKEIYFETIKCEDEEVFYLDYHNKRIARTIGLNLNLQEYTYPPNNKLLKCKIIYNQNEIINIEYSEYKPKDINNFKLIYDDTIDYKYKSTNRENINNLYNKKDKADEIIIIKNGLVTDTSIANIAIYENGVWLTPKKPLLQGTTLDRLVEEEYIKQSDITVNQLKKSKRIALMNAMIGFKILDKFTFS